MEILDKFIVQPIATGLKIADYKSGIFLEPHVMLRYLNNQLHGRQSGFYGLGQISHMYNYQHGKLHYTQYEWHRNGQLKKIEQYLHGIKHGIERCFNEDIELIYEGHYIHGKADGKFTRRISGREFAEYWTAGEKSVVGDDAVDDANPIITNNIKKLKAAPM